jgi:hypothetical protein
MIVNIKQVAGVVWHELIIKFAVDRMVHQTQGVEFASHLPTFELPQCIVVLPQLLELRDV